MPAKGARGWSGTGNSSGAISAPALSRSASARCSWCKASSRVAPSPVNTMGCPVVARKPLFLTTSIKTGICMSLLLLPILVLAGVKDHVELDLAQQCQHFPQASIQDRQNFVDVLTGRNQRRPEGDPVRVESAQHAILQG